MRISTLVWFGRMLRSFILFVMLKPRWYFSVMIATSPRSGSAASIVIATNTYGARWLLMVANTYGWDRAAGVTGGLCSIKHNHEHNNFIMYSGHDFTLCRFFFRSLLFTSWKLWSSSPSVHLLLLEKTITKWNALHPCTVPSSPQHTTSA